MYYKFFGLEQPPFRITPDTRLFFPGANRGAALEALVYAIVNGEGIIKVVGEVGSGKTMLCRMLALELPKFVDIVYIANPSLSPEHILHAIAFELRLGMKPREDRLSVQHALQDYLLAKHAENRRVVLFLEEAQSMPMETLEEVRLLSNLETGQDKLLQIVLFGQPELDATLARHDIRQLKDRITHSFMLTPFQGWEIMDYLNCRLRASGYHGGDVFTPRAVRAVERYSAGLVRRINVLADKAMLAAYADQSMTVTPKHVKMAAEDSEYKSRYALPRWAGFAAAAVLLLAVCGALLWLAMRAPTPAGATDVAAVSAAPAAADVALSQSGASAASPAPEQGPTAELDSAPSVQAAVTVAGSKDSPATPAEGAAKPTVESGNPDATTGTESSTAAGRARVSSGSGTAAAASSDGAELERSSGAIDVPQSSSPPASEAAAPAAASDSAAEVAAGSAPR